MNDHHDEKNQQETFDPVEFIHHGPSQDLVDPTQLPFLYNGHGFGTQLAERRGKLIDIEPLDPDLRRGTVYKDIEAKPKEIQPESGPPYMITAFNFKAQEVHYQALPATHINARAFGMTLLQNDECVKFPYDKLVMAEYSYGKWAAYESPYLPPRQGKGRSRELLTINPTDLEFHAFPHVFFSQDSLPLVITVARWRPYVNEIVLADLWLPPGNALVLPPKFPPQPPHDKATPEEKYRIVVDLHGNRNSALACRFVDDKPTLTTTTILANSAAMVDPKTKPYYYEEKTATIHPSGPVQ